MVNSNQIICIAFHFFIKTMIKPSGHGWPTDNKPYIYSLRPRINKLVGDFNDQNQSGYYMLSRFALADISLNKGNFKLMEKYYKSIINNKKFDKFYRDLALINLTINSKNIDKRFKLQKLQPILTSPSKLQPYAAELEILYLFNLERNKLANEKLETLLKRSDIKDNQKNRLRIIKRVFTN